MTSATDSSTGRRYLWVATVAGVLSATLGTMVLVGWHTHTAVLIQVLPAFVPMQYNTALCFLLCGLGLVVLVRGRPRLATALGSLAGFVGLLTLIEYAFGVELGIDQLLFEHYITVETSHPGRMAPNTALCFMLIAMAIIAMVPTRPTVLLRRSAGVLGVVVLLVSGVALIGYLTGTQAVYGWGTMTRMAVHTSVGFLVLALGSTATMLPDALARQASSSAFIPGKAASERRVIVAVAVGIMALSSLTVGVSIILELYGTGLGLQRARLTELVRSRAEMIDAVARFDTQDSQDVPGSARAATLQQVVEAQRRSPGFGETGEFTLGQREGDEILFIVRPTHAGPEFVERLGLGQPRAEPMQRALAGETGTTIALDYRGQRVVAAYAPVASLDLGLVAKMDLAELRAPFVRSALLTVVVSLMVIVVGACAIVLSINPLAGRVEQQALELHLANVELTREASEREEAMRALGVRECLLDGIYQTYPDVQFILERDGTVLHHSAGDESDLYLPAESFLGRRMQDLLPSVAAGLWDDALGAAGEQEGVKAFLYSLPMSGEDRDYEGRISVLPDGRFIAIARDITERRRAAEQVRQSYILLESRVDEATAKLQAANQELEAFAYSVSHDLKAPLRAIDGYSGMLAERHESSLPEDGRKLLCVVRSSAQQMACLIDDLLAFSQVGRSQMVLADVDMRKLAQAVFSDLSKLDGGRRVDFSVGELPTVRADLALIRLVWTNLLQNALKFTAGRELARIEIEHQAEPGHWVFRVRDNGVGFDMTYVDKLFGVFQRLHYQEEFPGTGVGLATVQRIIHRHGGEVWAKGEVDVGATVFFRLPRDVEAT